MKNQPRTGISLMAAIVLTLMALAAPLLAHGGFDHVRGTVVSVNNNVLTVKTSTGNVAVKLDGRTQITKNDQKAQVSDLVSGARVIVEVPQGKDKAAQSVKIGAARAATAGHTGNVWRARGERPRLRASWANRGDYPSVIERITPQRQRRQAAYTLFAASG